MSDEKQQSNSPPKGKSSQPARSSQWIAPSTGNPDLDPPNLQQGQRIDLRDPNPLTPQGMLFDPRQLIEQQRRGNQPGGYIPQGARFDPYGPPDPSEVGPGRGPLPSTRYGVPDPDHLPPPGIPDPDHLPPPGVPQQPPLGGGKSVKFPWGSGPPGSNFPPPGGAGGSPFL